MILVTGGSGFIGRATVAALLRHGAALRLSVHRRAALALGTVGVEQVRADLTDPKSLYGLCDGVDTLLHLASSIGDDEEACEAVNVRGTRALLAEARRAGVGRIIYLSTAAVYGTGPHRGALEHELRPAPVSPTSRTRLGAEDQVLAEGGIVLRPMFVYGPGDVWFIPALARTLSWAPVTIDGGRAALSMVAVDDLAEALTRLAVSHRGPDDEQIYHAVHPAPVTVLEIIEALVTQLGVPAPTSDLGYREARSLAGDDPKLLRRLDLLASDHFYDGSLLWSRTRLTPGGFAERFAAYTPWYRTHLQSAGGPA